MSHSTHGNHGRVLNKSGPKVKPISDRFWPKVDRTTTPDGCWLWTGANAGKKAQYGKIWKDGKLELAHRVSYEISVGPIPGGYQVDHLCRITLCVRPDHLDAVEPKENAYRARKKECLRGHEMSGKNLWINPKTGARVCQACARMRSRDGYHRKRKKGYVWKLVKE